LLRRRTAALLGGCWLALGCAGRQTQSSTPLPPAADTTCTVPAEGSGRWDTLAVAAGPSSDTGDVSTSPDGDRLVRALRYDTPIRLNCLDAPRPGLAQSWSRDSSGRAWTLRLGEHISSGDLASAWGTRPEASASLRSSGVESVMPLDDRRLVVSFAEPHDSIPQVLADPRLGVARTGGTPVRVIEAPAGGGDLRDALDRGVDLLETGDPELLEYARRRSDFTIVPLPWSTTYVVLLPTASEGLEGLIGSDTAAFRAGLARDAVRVEARGADGPFWWDGVRCADTSATAGARQQLNRVVFRRDDAIARALAERLVALAALPDLTASGLGRVQFSAALRSGMARAYVMALPHRALVPCRERARWPSGARVIPLVDTRSSAVLRRSHPELTIEWDGALRERSEQ
jgi:hypothetical protein